ncbi:MAG: M18 family aminopeptidase [Spirochaetales bacterium]|nr:M18 family aminopeptidase [Spirochaetales bacterium]
MKSEERSIATELIDFIDSCPTAYHSAVHIKGILDSNGFQSLNEKDSWKLESGKGYYIERNNSAVAAFIMGTEPPADGFLLAGAHTDSPGLKLKDDGEAGKPQTGYLRLPVEVYGGPIISTWLDRDLSIAGVVQLRDEGEKSGYKSVLFDFERPVAVIPNVAIHFNREVNTGFEYNRQVHLQALVSAGTGSPEGLKSLIAGVLGCPPEEIGGWDLFLYDCQPGNHSGLDRDLIVTGRIDNLAGCHAILAALLSVKDPRRTVGGFFFDNEEVGSATLQGADSGFLSDLLDRLVLVRGGSAEDRYRARAASYFISVDGAQAFHPNFPEMHDRDYAPTLNGGPVIKMNANYRYATTSEGAVFFKELCRKAGVPVQRFMMRSDLPCGSTIGPVTSAQGGIKTLDVGIPMLAMHSIRETCGRDDQGYMIRALSGFFKAG